MPATFVVVPVWQGSVSARAMSVADGAAAIQGDLPAAATVVVEVPVEAGEALGTGVHRYSTIRRVRERTEQALAAIDGLAITIGGDCGASLAAVAHASAATRGDLAVLWLDAHPDLNTPESSPSGGFGGMTLRAIAGDGADGLALDPDLRVAPGRLVIGGARAIDDEERRFIDEHGVQTLTVEDLSDPAVVIGALEATGATRVFIHIDLDVLDPSALAGLSYPIPFGVDGPTLVALVREIVARFPLAGAAIAGFAPATPEAADEDLPTILRLVGALASARTA
ncbi:arginase family protein [Agromyces aerolatus]|uniref:arginase family protein n=1 Tax=Agromyces sp. LY-1074 TaxID=3074080 RepID=UPI00285CB8EE|nr:MULTISPECIES: arginase family protein [unclassified Agromyces]MDR5701817.1 arginase family protein [Agromyces sp. LY-1074]MDR5707513.1 arginase family protein [Agromyces sp. LY-1358]